ncbi:MAG: hypothetical protein ACOY7T_08195 [Pseudomonadota bacterium]
MSENTRTPPAADAEPVAWLYSKIGCKHYVTANRQPQFVNTGSTETPLYTADQLQAYGDARAREALGFQARVGGWMQQTFSPEVRTDQVERAMRFLEEATELCQSIGLTHEKAAVVLDYVFGRPVGEPWQEVGGSMVTLAALCEAIGHDMAACGEREFARIDTPEMREKIAAKQVSKRLFGMTSALKENPNG